MLDFTTTMIEAVILQNKNFTTWTLYKCVNYVFHMLYELLLNFLKITDILNNVFRPQKKPLRKQE